jgi:ABC-type polysaccharide/polyol phosphate transport system ATPase subunit
MATTIPPAITAINVGVEYDLRLSRQRTIRGALGEWFERRGRAKTHRFWALRHVTFEMNEGEILGVVGRNGSGKSTLLLTIAGIVQPDEGTVLTFGGTASLLTLGAGFDPTLTGRDNIYLNGAFFGFSKRKMDARLNEIVAFSELGAFIDAPLRNYSSGMRSRLAFSIAAHIEPDILLLDEVLGVGDESFRQKSRAKLHELITRTKAIVVVSHSMAFVTDVCTKALWLQEGCIAEFGAPDDVVKRYTAAAREPRGPVRSIA